MDIINNDYLRPLAPAVKENKASKKPHFEFHAYYIIIIAIVIILIVILIEFNLLQKKRIKRKKQQPADIKNRSADMIKQNKTSSDKNTQKKSHTKSIGRLKHKNSKKSVTIKKGENKLDE